MQVRIPSKPKIGYDGKIYNVITVVEHGDEWQQRVMYAFEHPVTLQGESIGSGEIIQVLLDAASCNTPCRIFAARPYKSKITGVRNPHITVDEITTLFGNLYGSYNGPAAARFYIKDTSCTII